MHVDCDAVLALVEMLHEVDPVYGLFFFSSRSRHTRFDCDWSSDVCSSDLVEAGYCFFLSMTDGVARAIARHGDEALRRDLLPQLLRRENTAQNALFFSERAAARDRKSVV